MLNKKFLSLVLISAIYQQLNANPTGSTVVTGNVNIQQDSSQMTVTSDPQAIINWDSFSIQQQESVRFIQQGRSSAVLNRVTGSEMSSILGRIDSNGKVYLINPSGILVGKSGYVNTAGFIASTADISNADFSEGLSLHMSKFGSGQIVNLGTIHTFGGDVGLFARTIKNDGSIMALKGAVYLGSAPQILLKPDGTEHLFISADDPTFVPQIDNSGLIQTFAAEIKAGGSIYDKAISSSGRIEASVVHQEGGRVFLAANQGRVEISGEIVAPSGNIDINAKDIHLTKNSQLDVSSSTQNAGQVMAMAKRAVAFEGEILGSSEKGNGGKVELSGDTLHYKGKVNLTAKNGQTGNLLLDPKFINVTPAGSDPVSGNSLFSDNSSGTSTISGADLSTAIDAANVTLQANTDLNIQDIVTGTTSGNGLTLQAGRSINIIQDPVSSTIPVITLNGGDFNATINDSGAVSADRDTGDAQFLLNGGAQILTQGGNLIVDVGNFNGSTVGEIMIDGSSTLVDTAGGTISLTGVGNPSTFNPGVQISNGSLVQTNGTGTVTIAGTAGDLTTDNNMGVHITDPNTKVSVADGALSVTGTGKGSGNNNYGFFLGFGAELESTGAGAITINATGAAGADNNYGFYATDTDTTISAGTGDINITGNSIATGNSNFATFIAGGTQVTTSGNIVVNGNGSAGNQYNNGVRIQDLATQFLSDGSITITGIANGTGDGNAGIATLSGCQFDTTDGDITFNGTSGPGTQFSHGVIFDGETLVTTDNGDVTITGVSNAFLNDNSGILIGHQSVIKSTGTGIITLEGTGASGTNSNYGIYITDLGTLVEANDGEIIVNATANGAAGSNIGFVLQGAAFNSTGSAPITITGTGGNGTDHNMGIGIWDHSHVGTHISTIDSDITLNGTGRGTEWANFGLSIDTGSHVFTTGTGNINIHGIASSTNTYDGFGVLSGNTGTLISTVDGNINIIGEGKGSQHNNLGALLNDNGTISSTGAGNITIEATAGNADGSSTINMGVMFQNYSVSTAEGSIDITGTGKGPGSNAPGISLQNTTITSNGNGTITLTGTGGSGTDSNQGILSNTSDVLSAGNGLITINGTGKGTGLNNAGVVLLSDSSVSATGFGGISIHGEGAYGTQYNIGTAIEQTSVTSANGAIDITGISHASAAINPAVSIFTGGQVIGYNNASIMINGTGTTDGTDLNPGIDVIGGFIQTADGNLTLLGQGNGSGVNNFGLLFALNGSAEVTGSGNLSIVGIGSPSGTDHSVGITLADSGHISSANGPISLLGIGGGNGDANAGIALANGFNITQSGSDDTTITGYAGIGTNANGIMVRDSGTKIEVNSGDLFLTGKGGSASDHGVLINTDSTIRSDAGGVIIIKSTVGDSLID